MAIQKKEKSVRGLYIAIMINAGNHGMVFEGLNFDLDAGGVRLVYMATMRRSVHRLKGDNEVVSWLSRISKADLDVVLG